VGTTHLIGQRVHLVAHLGQLGADGILAGLVLRAGFLHFGLLDLLLPQLALLGVRFGLVDDSGRFGADGGDAGMRQLVLFDLLERELEVLCVVQAVKILGPVGARVVGRQC
jgi:hypothetical protein